VLKIITTADGSHSLLNETLHETYHSVHGAVQESKHVFIKHGLAFAAAKNSLPIQIVEVGFGTGLNALLSLQFAEQHHREIRYTSIEPAPLSEEVWTKLNYAVSTGLAEEYGAIHSANWNAEQQITSHFHLTKVSSTLCEATMQASTADVIYYDAFAPSKQPELWEPVMLSKVFNWLRPGGVLVTYCAKGQLKRDLRMVGFIVETLAGPPGKKEMVRGLKP
jgi:tRNA U34 5-methylaminomethyl-2-thiouridine-forming methyltransferase MnmC